MELSIITPTSKEKIKISWLELNTPAGNFVIQEGHIPTMLSLSPNQSFIYCLPDGKQEMKMVQTGFAHITRKGATLIVTYP